MLEQSLPSGFVVSSAGILTYRANSVTVSSVLVKSITGNDCLKDRCSVIRPFLAE